MTCFQAEAALVSTLTDSLVLGHMGHGKIVEADLSSGGAGAASQLFRVLQAAAQCCVDMHARYAKANMHASQLAECQMKLQACLQVRCQPLHYPAGEVSSCPEQWLRKPRMQSRSAAQPHQSTSAGLMQHWGGVGGRTNAAPMLEGVPSCRAAS
jgi:hypothetical protein